MSRQLPDDIRALVAERASYRCEYCLIPESETFARHQTDHIIARKHGGRSTLDNLAYACMLCNIRKGADVASYDEQTDRVVPLFNPRRDKWSNHFMLSGAEIRPLTPVGRVTVTLLQLNRPDLIVDRELLLLAGRLTAP